MRSGVGTPVCHVCLNFAFIFHLKFSEHFLQFILKHFSDEPQYHGVVDRDDVGLIFPADVKIDENRNVWVLSDRMHAFLIAGLDYSEVNFRIYSAPLQRLIGGTVCDLSTQISSRFGLNSILSTAKPSGSSIFANTLGLSQGLGGFKTINSNSATGSQSLQNIQSLSSQPLNAHALRVPLQPITQYSQLSPINPITQLSQLTPIAKISQIQSQQPLLAYDVREQINQQSPYASKSSLTPIFPTKSTGASSNGYYKGSTVSEQSSDFANAIQSLTKNPNWWTTQLW